ncbi:restriction endonuclease subunit S [Penaeicola halotolerans]|uniref:restriction endonuclease subunit S n=1 Tax=Penaeicola halotolerans TaxID=2793196 RepID=UPI001CF82141|nr:restriction endonuclease subunit S [Penaeicola halotolerans]
MKQGKMSEPRLSGFNDEQDLKTKKILKSYNQANPDSDNMKQVWEIKKLGEVVDIINGRNQSAVISESGQYPIYGSAGNLMGFATDYLCEEGTTIIGRKGNISNPIYIEEKFWNVDTAFGLYPKNGYDPKFINYLCQTIDFKSRNRGTTIPSLVKSDLITIDVPFISTLPEQQRIVSILDETFAAIAKAKANAEQNLKNAKELFDSYLQGVFENKADGWEEKTLGQLCVFTQGIQRDVKLQSEIEGANQVRFLRIVDYTQGNEPPRYIDFPGDKYILNTDDVALVRYGASTGFVCRGLEGALANNLFRVIPKSTEKLTTDFLFIYLNSPIFQNVIKATMNGAAMPAISFGLIEEIPFPLPPLKSQQTIVRQLDALRTETQKLEAVYQKKIDDLEELKKSILQKAFSGQLSASGLAGLKDEQDFKTVNV